MIGNDENGGALTKEELEFIEQVTLRAPDEDLTYAQVFPVTRIPNPEAESHQYFIAEDDEGSAELVTALEDAPELKVSNNRVTYPVYKIKLKTSLAESEIAASRSFGIPLDVAAIERVKRNVDEKANALAYVGDKKFGVPGILSGSGFTAITGADWGTANLDLANEIIKYMNQIPRKFRKRQYTLVLGDASYTKLQNFFNSSSSVGDRSHLERIKSAYPNLEIVNEASLDAGTELYDGSTLAAGVGLFVPKDKNLCQMTVAKVPYTLAENKIIDEKVNMAVAARYGIVQTPFPTAIGKITGLEG